MVKVKVTLTQNKITSLHIKDHAGSAAAGEDLVCAGVSSICFGGLNALDEICNETFDFKIEEANVKIDVRDINCEKTQLILNTMYIQLLTVANSYSKFIKITKVEV